MARLGYILICCALMGGFYAAYYWMTHAYGPDYGAGFGMGCAFAGLIAGGYISLRYGE